jgi:Skp family chaperone for outer membrane proteins
MKRFVLSVLLGALLSVPPPLMAQAKGQKIAIINVLRAIVDCAEGQKVNGDFQKKYDVKRDELAKKQKELQDLQQQLTTQGGTMTDEARAALGRSIDQKTTAFQRSQEDAEKEFTNLRNEIFSRIGTKMTPIVQQYAKEKNFTLVLDYSPQTGQLAYTDPALDITDDIIKRYDGLQVSQKTSAPTAPKQPSAQSPRSTLTAPPNKAQGTAGKAPVTPPKKN